jgi:hypothetical protein
MGIIKTKGFKDVFVIIEEYPKDNLTFMAFLDIILVESISKVIFCEYFGLD